MLVTKNDINYIQIKYMYLLFGKCFKGTTMRSFLFTGTLTAFCEDVTEI